LVGGLWVKYLLLGIQSIYYSKELWLQNHCVKQKGILLAAFLNAYSFHCCCAGIAAYVVNDPAIMLGASAMENLPGVGTADRAYPWLLHFLPAGLKGWHLLLWLQLYLH
jgi:SSS family solute:Na+ symporter